MNEAISKEVLARLDAMADKLGVAAGHLWAVLVRQQVAEGVAWLVVAPLGLLIAWSLFRMVKRMPIATDRYHDDDTREILLRYHDDDTREILLWLSGALVVAVAVVNLICVPDAILMIANPEYYAFQALIGK